MSVDLRISIMHAFRNPFFGRLFAGLALTLAAGIVHARGDSEDGYDLALKMYCLKFEQLSNTYEFRKDIIEHMTKSPWSVDRFWTDARCTPGRIGGTVSPLLHLVAEDVGGRRAFLEALFKYYQGRKDEQQWLRVVNARNSRGHTLLDYIHWMELDKEIRPEEREDIDSLVKYACQRGGVYSALTPRSCPR